MAFQQFLHKIFPKVYSEEDFVKKTHHALVELGFSADNSIVSVCICRDEISQPFMTLVKDTWGDAFNLSSLGGMFFAGQTGLIAAMQHAPDKDGRERYIYFALPHIAMDMDGRLGVCRRKGKEEESNACGALGSFQKELAAGKLHLSMDEADPEQSLLKRRLLREIFYGHVPDLLELTKIAQKVVQKDLEHAVNTIINRSKSDYAMLSGIQIHGPEGNYVWPGTCYAVVRDLMQEIEL